MKYQDFSKSKRPHQNLFVWQEGIKFVKDIYLLTKKNPNEEKFGITSQLRRASVSVPVNIAEGAAKRTKKDNIKFLYISRGSLSEIDTLLIISFELDYISNQEYEQFNEKVDRVSTLLAGLIKKNK